MEEGLKMGNLKEVLMARDGMTSEEADEVIRECKEDFLQRIEEGDMSADDALMDHFGLEPDYVFDLLD